MFIASVAFVDIVCFFLAGICMTALLDRDALYGAASVVGGNITQGGHATSLGPMMGPLKEEIPQELLNKAERMTKVLNASDS